MIQIPLIFRRVERNSLFFILIFFLGSLFLLKPRISGDGFSYYAWLRSATFDRNLDFSNEYDQYNIYGYATASDTVEKTGLRANPYSIGPALLWAPWFLLAYVLTVLFGNLLNLFNDGYSFFYQLLIPLGTLFYALFGTLLLNRLLTRYFSSEVALWSILGVLFATPLLNYLFNEPASSHTLSFFVISLFYWYWLKSNQFESSSDSYLGGLAAGLMCLVRWQHAIFVVPVFLIMVIEEHRYRDFLFFGIAAAAAFSFQILSWRIIYGDFLLIPQGTDFFIPVTQVGTWINSILLLLFSPNHGLIYWTPFVALGMIGLLLFIKMEKWLGILFVLLLLLSLAVNSSVREFYGGWGYGARRTIEILPILCFGLAALWSMEELRRYKKPVTLVCIGWNCLLWLQFIGQRIDAAGTLRFPLWVFGQITAIRYLPVALGRSTFFSELYWGFTSDALAIIQALFVVILITILFLLFIILLSYQDKRNAYL